jgi:hypothetical protein
VFCSERLPISIGPVLRRSAFLMERRERALAFPIEVRVFLEALLANETLFGFGERGELRVAFFIGQNSRCA